jgi:hypothetical protein
MQWTLFTTGGEPYPTFPRILGMVLSRVTEALPVRHVAITFTLFKVQLVLRAQRLSFAPPLVCLDES